VAHLHTIPVDLVHVPQATNEQVEIRRCTRGGCDRESAAIPGVAGVRGVALPAPGLVDGDLLPSQIVERWIGPGWVVSDVELPGPSRGARPFPSSSMTRVCPPVGGAAYAKPDLVTARKTTVPTEASS
jgi:hypothetical protein